MRVRAALIASFLGLLLAGCGSGSESAPPAEERAGGAETPDYAFVEGESLACPDPASISRTLGEDVRTDLADPETCRYEGTGRSDLAVVLSTAGNYDSTADVEAVRTVLEGEGGTCALYDHPANAPALDCSAPLDAHGEEEEHTGEAAHDGEAEVHSAEIYFDAGLTAWVGLTVIATSEDRSLAEVTLARDDLVRELAG